MTLDGRTYCCPSTIDNDAFRADIGTGMGPGILKVKEE